MSSHLSLCFDLGSAESSVCLFDNSSSAIVSEVSLGTQRQSEKLITSLDEILKEAKVSLSEVSDFVVGIGPGSFTGLRIGLSTVKAFALTLNKPVVSLNNHEVRALEWVKLHPQFQGRLSVITQASAQWLSLSEFEKSAVGLQLIQEQALETASFKPENSFFLLDKACDFNAQHEVFPLKASYLGRNRKDSKQQNSFSTLKEICNLTPFYGIPSRFD